MKKTLFTLLLSLSISCVLSQKVEPQVWGISTLISPISIYNETRLGDRFALRTELNAGFAWASSSSFNGNSEWAFIPILISEPRFYYNLQKRHNKGKSTHRNSGNFLSLNAGYQPGIAIGSENADAHQTIHLIPFYGLRRNIGKHFVFETGLGVGYSWIFEKFDYFDFSTETIKEYKNTKRETSWGIRLNFGYLF